MKLSLTPPILLLALIPLRADPPPAADAKAVPLFDGTSLDGWEGNAKLWRVEEGEIRGGLLTGQVKENVSSPQRLTTGTSSCGSKSNSRPLAL